MTWEDVVLGIFVVMQLCVALYLYLSIGRKEETEDDGTDE